MSLSPTTRESLIIAPWLKAALVLVCLLVLSLSKVYAATSEQTLPEIARQTLYFHFDHAQFKQKSLSEFANSFYVPPQWKRHSGVFVTLSLNGKSRACWGSLYPEYPDLVKAVVYTTAQALKREYRFPPIKESEWRLLKPQVTIVNALEPIAGGVSGLSGQNPLADGLFVRSGGKTAVLLPGEVRDAYYQLVKCKLKAGIKAKEPCQIWRVKADVIR